MDTATLSIIFTFLAVIVSVTPATIAAFLSHTTGREIKHIAEETAKSILAVHTLVNSRDSLNQLKLTEQTEQILALTKQVAQLLECLRNRDLADALAADPLNPKAPFVK